MRAVTYRSYGGPEVLDLVDIEKPEPEADQVRIEIRATAVNPMDYRFLSGTPRLVRLMIGVRRPKKSILGHDVAGVVDAIGADVTALAIGDEVLGSSRGGGFAEFVCTKAKNLLRKPANVTFSEGAAVPIAALTALQGLRDKGEIRSGQQVLVYGASGGVGTYAVQLAKWMGATVTAVCSTRNLELVKSLGADEVVDYTETDFADGHTRYDVIFDAVGKRRFNDCRRALTPTGRYISTHLPIHQLPLTFVPTAIRKQRMMSMLAKTVRSDMEILVGLLESGEMKSVIDRSYTLEQTPQAMQAIEEGRTRGKLVVIP